MTPQTMRLHPILCLLLLLPSPLLSRPRFQLGL
jgi:hypothetical protein